ncbi:PREDICTED: fascin-2 [Myotis davidii]|uniref:fascin-2 n=1 Tax=Myotis davidii TaxID=225400 RepID=UPI00076772A7|nr:PREDICTED: fascin-2 [Myotis davidii]
MCQNLGGPGVNVSANQDEELDHETFLMQTDRETKKCTFYASTGGYWTLVTHGGASHLLPPGVNVSANQDEELDHETFLMQTDRETKKCTFYASTGGYWTLVTHGGIQATATQVSASTMFEVEWRGRRVALKASNGRYVCMKKNGQLAAVSDFVGELSPRWDAGLGPLPGTPAQGPCVR